MSMVKHNGWQNFVLTMSNVTLDEFREKYNKMACEAEINVKASNIIPRTETNGGSFLDRNDKPLFDCVIFYDQYMESKQYSVSKPVGKDIKISI